MSQCRCDYCTDLRYVMPAKMLGTSNCNDDEIIKMVEKAKADKDFIEVTDEYIAILIGCPNCGYIFTKEDYDKCVDI